MTTSELWRTTGHVDSSAHTQDVHTKREGGSALRDKVLWVTGLVSEVNAYSILTQWQCLCLCLCLCHWDVVLALVSSGGSVGVRQCW